MNRKIVALLVGALVAIAGFAVWIPGADAATPGCDNVAVIRCGVKSEADLLAKYDSNPNSAQKIFQSFGISRSDLGGFTSGTIYKDGRVVVGGKTVATSARTAGHNWGQGDPKREKIAGTDAYKYSTSQLASDARPVMVKMVSGQFKFAVMNDCGNPVSATPVPPTPTPTPVTPKATPVYTCDKLTASKITRTKYTLTTAATAKDGASITGYIYDFGDDTTQDLGINGKTAEHEYAKPGTYDVSVTAKFTVNGQVKTATGAACKTQITVAPVPVTPKETPPVYSCDKLSASKITRTKYAFSTTTTAKDGATVTGYTYNYGDGTTEKLDTAGKTIEHEYTQAGTYTVSVEVEFAANGKTKTSDGADCTVKVTITPENTLQVCDIANKVIITINESDFDSTKHTKTLSECDIKVCQISTKTIMKISPEDVTSDYTTDLKKCETPVVPAAAVTTTPAAPAAPATVELPHTGAADIISGSLGLGTMSGAGYYYLASRRALGKRL